MDQKHSGLGIASFIISIVVGMLAFLVLIVAGIMEVSTPGGLDENSMEAIVVGLCIIGLCLVDLVALGLGIGGLCQKERKRIFAILGTVFSALTVLGVVILIIMGTMM